MQLICCFRGMPLNYCKNLQSEHKIIYIGRSIYMKSNSKYNGSNEYQKAIDFLEKGCKCGCSSGIPKEGFAELRESFQTLSKTEQDISLMAQLKAMGGVGQ